MATMPDSDQLRTGWTGKHKMDGSELYQYTSDFNELVVRIREDFFDEPDDDFDEDDPQRYTIDKWVSYWNAECRFYGEPELFPLGESYRQEGGSKREGNVAFCYWDSAASADEALLRRLIKIPRKWRHDADTWQRRIRQGWTESYQPVAGKVGPPTWL